MTTHSRSLTSILRDRAASHPERVAYHFLSNGIDISTSLTYAELDLRARAIAAELQCRRVVPGERALLQYPEGLEFITAFFGCLYAGVIAVPIPFSASTHSQEGQTFLPGVLADAQPALVLTPGEILDKPNELALPVFHTDDLDLSLAEKWQPAENKLDLACIQFTSGSTSTPKGVMLTHNNLVHYLSETRRIRELSEDSAVLSWLPHVYSFGILEGFLRSIEGGFTSYIQSPGIFAREPLSWLRAITRYRITYSGAPAFAFDQCVRQVVPAQRTGLDLSTWRVALVGGESNHPEVLTRFLETYAEYGFRPSTFFPTYGLTEAILATSKVPGTPVITRELKVGQHQVVLTSCGRSYGGSVLKIVDPQTHQRLPDGQVGEVWLAGPSVSPGYWNRPRETRETFGAYLAPSGEGPFLRTGDLGLIDQGELFITGRLKDLLIIHGRNYYPQDIEQAIESSHPSLRPGSGAVFSIDADSSERIVVVFEVEKPSPNASTADPPSWESVASAVRRTVAAVFGLPVYAIALLARGTLPKTNSGKVQRQATRQAWLDGKLDALYHWKIEQIVGDEARPEESNHTLERGLVSIWQELLGISQVDPEANFFALGGDSLSALRMTLFVEEQLGHSVPIEFFQNPTLSHLTDLLAGDPPLKIKAFIKSESKIESRDPVPGAASNNAPSKSIRRKISIALIERGPVFYNKPFPYALGVRLQRAWVQLPYIRRKVKEKSALFQKWLDILEIPDPDGTHLELSTLANTWIDWRKLCLQRPDAVEKWVDVKGIACYQKAQAECRPMVIILYHYAIKAPVVQSIIHRYTDAEIYQYARRVTNIDEEIAIKLHQARGVLKRGGIVFIAGDGAEGRNGITIPWFGHPWLFRMGAAELAVQTNAIFMPVFVTLSRNGRVSVEFTEPISPLPRRCHHRSKP